MKTAIQLKSLIPSQLDKQRGWLSTIAPQVANHGAKQGPTALAYDIPLAIFLCLLPPFPSFFIKVITLHSL